jgi:hypothetical protein
LQQHGGAPVGAGSPQQQTRRAVSTPEMGAVVGQHPAVTVTMHLFRIGNVRRNGCSGWLARIPPAWCRQLLEFLHIVGAVEKVAGKLRSAHR